MNVELQEIEGLIYIVRGKAEARTDESGPYKVMLDRDLARLYGVTTFNLNKGVQRNMKRFPADFMFQLTKQALANLKSKIGMSSLREHGGRRMRAVFDARGSEKAGDRL